MCGGLGAPVFPDKSPTPVSICHRLHVRAASHDNQAVQLPICHRVPVLAAVGIEKMLQVLAAVEL